jgi:hypothetical protein
VRAWGRAAGLTLAVLAIAGTLTNFAAVPRPAGASAATSATGQDAGGPAKKYQCAFNVYTDAFTGAYGTASDIGWEGNGEGVVTCLGGSFAVLDGIYKQFGFGIYTGTRTTWADAQGYLPAQITTFPHAGAIVTITEFADRVVLGGDAFVAVYCRVAVRNPTSHAVLADPDASAALVPLNAAPDTVKAHGSAVHDYVLAVDRFGNQYPWPTSAALAAAGGFDAHYANMRTFWNRQLTQIAQVDVPDTALNDAYRSGFISTQIARSGDDLNTGVNNYASEFSHDVIGILTNLFTQGYYSNAQAFLLEARKVVGSAGQYDDGVWTYAVPWAVYLMKTGDLSFVRENFSTEGPAGAATPSIEDAAHEIAADRTGPSGIMEATNDIDTQGYWTTDDFEALLGLAAYRYIATAVGDTAEATWAQQQYDSLLAATDTTLEATMARYRLDYLPCSLLQPNTANRCTHPEDANWTSPFGNWAWEGSLLGAMPTGPGLTMIDATYAYGFKRLKGKLPPDTFGGFPTHYYYSSGYNAADGSAGLAGQDYRDQGILSYEFMIANSESGPNSWWESSTAPSTTSPWVGRHPTGGQGSSPHAWGMAGANKVLLDSLVAQSSDGDLIVGRGVPASWLGGGPPMSVANFPTTDGRRLTVRISSTHQTVSLVIDGQLPKGPVLFQIPSFIKNIASTSAGKVDEATGTVLLPPGTERATVRLRVAPRK